MSSFIITKFVYLHLVRHCQTVKSLKHKWKYVNYKAKAGTLPWTSQTSFRRLFELFFFLIPCSSACLITTDTEHICSEVRKRQAPWMLKKPLMITTLAMERKGEWNIVSVPVTLHGLLCLFSFHPSCSLTNSFCLHLIVSLCSGVSCQLSSSTFPI